MAYSRPNLRYRRSLLNRTLLCGLALIAGSTLGGAQEPQGATGPDAFDADVADVDTRMAGGDTSELVARLEAELLLTELVAQARYEEAIPIAERMVELAEEESGVSIELGVALSNLAILQRSLEL
ncbi:MAG: hypothetical protein V3W02_04055, partial [Gammaproteobacteria bacterium]